MQVKNILGSCFWSSILMHCWIKKNSVSHFFPASHPLRTPASRPFLSCTPVTLPSPNLPGPHPPVPPHSNDIQPFMSGSLRTRHCPNWPAVRTVLPGWFNHPAKSFCFFFLALLLSGHVRPYEGCYMTQFNLETLVQKQWIFYIYLIMIHTRYYCLKVLGPISWSSW